MTRISRSIYIAAPFIRKTQARLAGNIARLHGHTITSRWIESPEQRELNLNDPCNEFRLAQVAIENWHDILAADVFFQLTFGYGESHGGMNVEFGMAMASGVKCIIIGPRRENIFHCLLSVMHFDSISRALSFIEADSPWWHTGNKQFPMREALATARDEDVDA